VYYGNPTPVVAAIVQQGDDVILARNRGWPDGCFGLVTGFLEAGETPEAGVLRELHEELGLAGTIRELVGVYAFAQRNEIIIAYHVEAEGEIVLGPELEVSKRVPIAKLRPWPFGTGEAVRDWLSSRSRTP
jgi:ADP-ribose pyrophosphatase YjhB (NUDIX family)